jgi:hypothetical protein
MWAAKIEVPPLGASTGGLTVADLQANQDYPPKGWTAVQIKEKLNLFNSYSEKD